jgi:hypothetical protein
MPKSKSRKKRPPKRVLALPGPRTRHDGGAKQPDVRQRPAHLRSRNSPVRRMRPTMQFRISTQFAWIWAIVMGPRPIRMLLADPAVGAAAGHLAWLPIKTAANDA